MSRYDGIPEIPTDLNRAAMLGAISDAKADTALNSGGTDGTSGGMEARIARLEAHAEHAQADLGVLKTDMRDVRDRLTGLEVKVDHLPSKGFIVAAATAGIALLSAVIGLAVAYQDFLANLTR